MVDVDVHISDSLASMGLLCIHVEINRQTEVTITQFKEYITVFSAFLVRSGDEVVSLGEELGARVIVSPPQWFPLVIEGRIVEKIGITMRVEPPELTKKLIQAMVRLN